MGTKNISAVLGRAYQSPLGRTLQLRRVFETIGMIWRMAEDAGSFYRETEHFVCTFKRATLSDSLVGSMRFPQEQEHTIMFYTKVDPSGARSGRGKARAGKWS